MINNQTSLQKSKGFSEGQYNANLLHDGVSCILETDLHMKRVS
jgi:hypothetical protein